MVRRLLNVAEKPSAAKEIARILCGNNAIRTRSTQARYTFIYEFSMVVENSPVQMIFTSVLGHLMETEFESRLRKWGSCDPAILLDPETSQVEWAVAPDKTALAQMLRSESRQSDGLILWLDCDSEGEKIAVDVAEVCKEGNRRLIVQRARFSAMTRRDLFHAISHLGSVNSAVANMVATRQEIDLRAGAAYTRFLTTLLEKFDLQQDGDRQMISYGPCQFPTLGLVVDRWLTIQNFKSRSFWCIKLELQNCSVPFEWIRKQLFDEFTACILYELCFEEGEADGFQAHVAKVEKRMRTKWRPLPLSTVELQKVASRSLNITSHRAMSIAESLYNKGLISYPRTETDRFDSSYDLQGLVAKHTSHPDWGNFASRLLSLPNQHASGNTSGPPGSANVSFTWPRAGRNDDKAHPPIHPTNNAPDSFESNDHKRMFEYITKRFLACCSVDAKGSETRAQVRVGSSECFEATGLIVEEKGFLEVMYPFERWNDRDMPTDLLQVDAHIPITSLLLVEGRTQPPPLLQEADLIALMDHHGIGTDATIAEHINKVLERAYVHKVQAGRFSPTDIGKALVISHERCRVQLARPHMRAKQEEDLKQILTQNTDPDTVLRNALTTYKARFQRLRRNSAVIDSVFQDSFTSQSTRAQSWQVLAPQFAKCGSCLGPMMLKGNNIPAGSSSRGARGRGRGRGYSRGRGRGRGGRNPSSASDEGVDRCVFCERCSSTLMLPRHGNLAPTGQDCPLCRFEVLTVSNGTNNSSHTVCPKCYNEPPSDASVNGEAKTRAFRCYHCSHASCQFSRGTSPEQVDIARCPLCNQPCAIKTGQDPGIKYIRCASGRVSCAFVYWFPRNVIQSISTESATCERCDSKKLGVTWRQGSVPPGTSSFSGCIWCDSAWTQTLMSIGESGNAPRPPHPGARNQLQRNGSSSAPLSNRAGRAGVNTPNARRGQISNRRVGSGRGTGTRARSHDIEELGASNSAQFGGPRGRGGPRFFGRGNR